VKIKGSINKGLSEKLKTAFLLLSPELRPEVKLSEIPDPY
jgi:hypothetical protein